MDLASYPDRSSSRLREALSRRHALPPDHFLIGNGSTELIHLLARARLSPDAPCLIFAPTFGEYEAAAALQQSPVHLLRSTEADGFHWSIDSAISTIEAVTPTLTFLCNPNNPTGRYLDRDFVARLLAAIPPHGLLVLDEAYVPFLADPWDGLPLLDHGPDHDHDHGNLAIIRSLTKDHALAGVRLGYLIARPPLVASLRHLQPSWSVNAVAQTLGLVVLDDDHHAEQGRVVARDAIAYLTEQLAALSLPVTPSDANFLLVRVGDAHAIRQSLLQRGFAVRDCTSFGLPHHIRLAARPLHECEVSSPPSATSSIVNPYHSSPDLT